MAAQGDDALVGRVLNDRYLIVRRIARGGMATVYMATDQRLDRTVAVKVMHQNLGDEVDFLDRFNREAKAAARLNHRGVVSVFDQGADGETTYLVMEYIAGLTLRDVLRAEAPMSPERSLGILADVLVALASAHAAGIIHRDIKPENVLVTPDGNVKVADFGLARAVSTATTAPGGALIGTVSYLAPEIVLNERADARSDVYACGAMLYEMLTASKPHGGDTPIQIAYKHVHEDIGAPSAVQPGLPDFVDALVARATARDRHQRPADARLLLQLVRRVQRALDQGLTNDPVLTEQLLPVETVALAETAADGREASDHAPTTRVSSSPMFPARRDADTDDPDSVETDIVAGDVEQSEPTTVQWSTGAAATPRGAVPAVSSEYYRDDRKSLDNSKRGLYLLATVLGLAALLAGVSWYFGFARYDKAPSLVGMTETNATSEADAAGYTFKVQSRVFSETAPLGTVMQTKPQPGSRVLPGALIEGTVSKGPERHPIPKLRGLTMDEAVAALRKERLVVGTVTQDWSDVIPKGSVKQLSGVDAGTRVKRDTKVNFVVSKGREPVQVVNTAGQTRGTAYYTLQQRGFLVAVRQQYNDRVAVGRVISQVPSSGTKYKGDTITLTVSLGPERINVPGVIGKSLDDAKDTLEDLGFDVSERGGEGNVVKQEPAGGKAKVGSTIIIWGRQLPPGQPNPNRD